MTASRQPHARTPGTRKHFTTTCMVCGQALREGEYEVCQPCVDESDEPLTDDEDEEMERRCGKD